MAFVLNENATGLCTHGGSARAVGTVPRVKVAGAKVLVVTNSFNISACPNQVGGQPFPCVQALIANGAARVKALGQPVLLDTAKAINTPTGASLSITPPQTRVKGL